MPTAPLRRDLALAFALAAVLGTGWTWAAWNDLAHLLLPDTDDVVRLQQVRDWLAGQPWRDVAQHRLGAGLPMHWSRVADLAPAALIALATPIVGGHAAEVAAMVVWPLALFAAALALVGRIARTLGPGLAGTATAVAAIGYPATTLFLPGRIDHHGLQMVLLVGATLALLRPAGAGAGVVAGLAAALSLAIGLETMPFFAVLGVVAIVDWIAGRDRSDERLQGLGIGALVGLAAAKGLIATDGWNWPACDGFTAQAWRAALALAIVPLALAAGTRVLAGSRVRATAALTAGTLASLIALAISPACLAPYGAVDPLMARLWLTKVGEAQPLFAAPLATAIGYGGLMLAGILASLWRLRATRTRGWAVLLALQLASLALAGVQLRGAYPGALLAAPALAAAIGRARAKGAASVAGAWVVSAGMLYPIAAQALVPAMPDASQGQGDCASPALLAAADRLGPGLVIAPIDAGAALLAGTHARVLAAPYHRNDAANLDGYRFYLAGPAAAHAIADRWHATAWLSCAAMPGPARAVGLPGWHRATQLADGAAIWTRDTLWKAPARR